MWDLWLTYRSVNWARNWIVHWWKNWMHHWTHTCKGVIYWERKSVKVWLQNDRLLLLLYTLKIHVIMQAKLKPTQRWITCLWLPLIRAAQSKPPVTISCMVTSICVGDNISNIFVSRVFPKIIKYNLFQRYPIAFNLTKSISQSTNHYLC